MAVVNPNLSAIQFKPFHEKGMSGIEAFHPTQGKVGHLYWNTDPAWSGGTRGRITDVEIYHKKNRGKGIASHMLGLARQIEPELHHAPAEHRTQLGAQFVNRDLSRNNPSSALGYGAS